MIGCAGMIAVVAFIFGAIIAMFAIHADMTLRLMMPVTAAALAFVAALILAARDHARHAATMRKVREMLLARDDVTDQDFCIHFPDADSVLLTQTRRAISEFFEVPVEKIHATDRLRDELQFDSLEPAFHSFVVYHVLNVRIEPLRPFTFNTANLTDIGDLTGEVQRAIAEMNTTPTNGE